MLNSRGVMRMSGLCPLRLSATHVLTRKLESKTNDRVGNYANNGFIAFKKAMWLRETAGCPGVINMEFNNLQTIY